MTPKCPDCKRDQDDCCCKDEIESLRQQLAAAIAACKLKDDALELAMNVIESSAIVNQLDKALAIQPDYSALKEGLGEPYTVDLPE